MKKIIKLLVTFVVIATAAYWGYNRYKEYIQNPWTRDGQVRTQVIKIAPRVTSMVTKIDVVDNQHVKKGDLLFELDPSQYLFKLKQVKARLQRARESSKGAKIEYERVRKIYARDKGAVSQKDLIRNEIHYYKTLADIESAKEALNSAKLNLKFTKVYAPVDGWVSNINFQIGTQVNANQAIMALVDEKSFWVFGFFREDAIKDIKEGDSAIVTLMAYSDLPLKGKVESIGWGIAPSDGLPGNNLLPKVKPVFHWIRLAQRIPVRIKLDKPLPKGVKLRVGMSASVLIQK